MEYNWLYDAVHQVGEVIIERGDFEELDMLQEAGVFGPDPTLYETYRDMLADEDLRIVLGDADSQPNLKAI